MIGDEPFQMKQKFPDIYMAVDHDRCHGIEKLCNGYTAPGTEVVILDDAFQHRYVKPGMNILLVDYHRPICEDALLPAGRMRESEKGKNRAHIVIITKCPKDITPMDVRVLRKQMGLYPYQQLYFTTLNYGKLYPITRQGKEYPITNIHKDAHILLVTGIASPAKLIHDLSPYNEHINPLTFSDHHDFTPQDMEIIKGRFEQLPESKRMIITTEKDAVRLSSHPLLDETIKPFIYVLPIEVSFLHDQQELFNLNITEYVRKNPRDRSFSEREDAY